MIDSIFNKTSWVMKAQVVLFFVFFLIPFIFQIFYTTEPKWVKVCIWSCLLSQIVFAVIEFLQIRKLGWSRYLSSVTNIIDVSLIVLFLVYAVARLLDPSKVILPKTGNHMQAGEVVFWVVMNSLMLINALFKSLFFLRIFKSFGMLVELISQVLRDIKYFMLFFICWLVLFSILYRIAGIQIEEDDYSNLWSFLTYIIVIFRNSIGDEQMPNPAHWLELSEK